MAKTSIKYYSNKKKPGKTKAFFICLLIACFLWIIHALNTVYNYNISMPVDFINLPQNKKPQNPLPEHLSVDLQASGLRLALILLNRPFDPLTVDFNLLKATNRKRHYVLSASNLNFKSVLKFSTKIKQVSPDTLYFSDKVGYQKNVPIQVPLFLNCEEGYGYGTPEISPAFVTIWGDTTLLDLIDTVYSQPLSFTNLNKDVDSKLDLVRPSNNVHFAVAEAAIKIKVDKLIQHTIQVKVYDLNEKPQQKVNVFPASVKIIFTSINNSFSDVDTLLFKAVIDSEKINPQTNKCKVNVQLFPDNVTIMEIEPKEVEILILKQR